jgi:hypothetical protein
VRGHLSVIYKILSKRNWNIVKISLHATRVNSTRIRLSIGNRSMQQETYLHLAAGKRVRWLLGSTAAVHNRRGPTLIVIHIRKYAKCVNMERRKLSCHSLRAIHSLEVGRSCARCAQRIINFRTSEAFYVLWGMLADGHQFRHLENMASLCHPFNTFMNLILLTEKDSAENVGKSLTCPCRVTVRLQPRTSTRFSFNWTPCIRNKIQIT